MVYSICIPINMHREGSLIKLGKPFPLKGNFIVHYFEELSVSEFLAKIFRSTPNVNGRALGR